MNEETDYSLLAEIMENAAGFYEWKKGRQQLLRVILNSSFRVHLPTVRFPNHDLLTQHTQLQANRLSESLKDLARCRLVKRKGHGKWGVELTPLPDWWNWAGIPINEQCANPNYIASQIGYIVRDSGSNWVAVPYPAPDAVTQDAHAYSRGSFQKPPLIPEDQRLNQTKAEVACGETLKKVKKGGHLRDREETPEALDVDELIHRAGELFPKWTHYRRDAWIKTVAADKGFGTVFRALSLAKEFGPSRIRKPWAWLAKVVLDLVQTANKPDQ